MDSFWNNHLVTGGLKCAKQASKEDVVVLGKTSIRLVAENQDSHLYPPVIEMKPYQNVGIFEPYQPLWERLPDFWMPSTFPRIILYQTSLGKQLLFSTTFTLWGYFDSAEMSNAGIRSGESPDSFNNKCFLTKKHVKTAAFLVNFGTPKTRIFQQPPEKMGDCWQAKKKHGTLVAGPVTA